MRNSISRRSGRAAARRAAAALESTPRTFEGIDDDEPMPDANQEPEEQAEPEQEEEEAEKEASAAEEDTEDVEEAVAEEDGSHKSPSPPAVVMVRRKRLGRPPKHKPPGWDDMIEVPARESDLTPRRRGRGGYRGRGGRKGQPQQPTQQPIDKEGNMMDIVNDEVDLPPDPEGETKVDKLGNLLGGREYRCRTFSVIGRGDRLYMLSTEPARCVGFRDSYLFFTKHLRLFKIIVTEEEKRDMIEREIIPHSYKGRSIGIVTARSVFREFGSLIIVGGRHIVDDYAVAEARANGAVDGEIADPNDRFVPGEPYNKNQYVAWHGASAVYHTATPVVPQQAGKVDIKKRKVAVNDINWQLEHAREASVFNSQLSAIRRLNINGVYDMHTNMMHYPSAMQPTHARIEQIVDNGLGDNAEKQGSKVFPPLKPVVSRNFLVIDTHLETPPAGIPPSSYERPFQDTKGYGGHQEDFLASFRGLGAVSGEIKDLLPPECRQAFDEALQHEKDWHNKWGTEAEDKCRRAPIIDKAVVPFSMLQ